MNGHHGPEQAITVHRPRPVTDEKVSDEALLSPAQTRQLKRRQALTEDRKRIFLGELRVHGIVVEAAKVASPGSTHERGARTTFYEERSRNEDFAQEWDAAVERANGALEREIYRRGVEGFEEERVDSQGRVTILKKYSDACLLAQARSRMQQYRKSDVNKKVSGVVEHKHSGTVKYEDCSDEQRRHIRRFLASAPRFQLADN